MGNFNRDRGNRDNRRGGGRFNRGGGFNRPSMHKAICDSCHKDCEVPFKPTGNKPIFCSDCFNKQGGGNERRGGGDRDRKPRFESSASSDNSKEILKGIKTLNYKMDELIKALQNNTPSEEKPEPASPKKEKTKKKTATKKKAASKKSTKKKK